MLPLAIVGQLYLKDHLHCNYTVFFIHYFLTSGLASSRTSILTNGPPNLLKSFRLIWVEFLHYRMALSPTTNNLKYTFPRLVLHACAITRTTSLSYRGISLSQVLFHFPRAISID